MDAWPAKLSGNRSVFGEVKSSFRRGGGKTVYEITVPANCKAQLRLPGGRTEELVSGVYSFFEEN